MSKVHLHHVKKDIHKLSKEQINSIEDHYQSENISFPLPDKKYKGKRFMQYSLKCSARMYNLCPSTTRKISTSTYYCYKPKAVKTLGPNSIQAKLLREMPEF